MASSRHPPLQHVDIVTIEIGSTITKVNGFQWKEVPKEQAEKGGAPRYLAHVAQGFHTTTVNEGDVSRGVEGALAAANVDWEHAEIFINSSAAGGLKMSVHGLTPSMTARAAREASLGAGGIIRKLTAGPLFEHDLAEICDIKPNLILLAGGVDYGDTSVVYENARKLFAKTPHNIPIIYAGNIALQGAMRKLAEEHGRELWITENVFPAVDVLNVAPLRQLIHEAFARHIIHAPGMQKLYSYTQSPVIPTPGAVLLATRLFAELVGDTVVIDVGGATTDVHSVTDGSNEYVMKMIEPEPREKRTVEGDLGVFVNAEHVLALDPTGSWRERRALLRAMPQTTEEQALTHWLCEAAVLVGVQRHAGMLTELYTASGRRQVVRGKDLSAVTHVVGTGGALTRVQGGEQILRRICCGIAPVGALFGGTVAASASGPTGGQGMLLLPPPNAKVLLDRNYLFSALGTLAEKYPNEVKETFKKVFEI